jgi:hypothetical protein
MEPVVTVTGIGESDAPLGTVTGAGERETPLGTTTGVGDSETPLGTTTVVGTSDTPLGMVTGTDVPAGVPKMLVVLTDVALVSVDGAVMTTPGGTGLSVESLGIGRFGSPGIDVVGPRPTPGPAPRTGPTPSDVDGDTVVVVVTVVVTVLCASAVVA